MLAGLFLPISFSSLQPPPPPNTGFPLETFLKTKIKRSTKFAEVFLDLQQRFFLVGTGNTKQKSMNI
jgi:hypothetical protein